MKKVLIVEDDKTSYNTLVENFKIKNRLKPFVAKSFKEAKELMEKHNFFCAILDLILPDAINGQIVNFVLSKHIPSIALTSNISESLRKQINSKNIVDYVIKNSSSDMKHCVNLAESLVFTKRKKALVVDDSKTARAYIKYLFQTLLFDVIEASDAKEALDILDKNPDILIATVDYEMPNMNGIELINNIRAKFKNENLIIFGITSMDAEGIRASFLKSGANDYFKKPVVKEEFNTRVIQNIRLVEQIENIKTHLNLIDKYVLSSVTNTKGIITEVSEAFAKATGYKKEELIGRTHSILRDKSMPNSIFQNLWYTIKSGKTWEGEIKNKRKDGSFYWNKTLIEPIFDSEKKIVEYRALREDITDKKRIEKISITDKLTGIYNRVKLDKVLEKELNRAKIMESPLSIILLDIDKFKSVNDVHGHQVGDKILIEISKVLQKNISDRDILGRWGGEEFMIILPNRDINQAKEVAENLRIKIEEFEFSIVKHKTSSFGISSYKDLDKEKTLVKRADDALYLAKDNGRNRVEIIL